jgi:hypothetical protein
MGSDTGKLDVAILPGWAFQAGDSGFFEVTIYRILCGFPV